MLQTATPRELNGVSLYTKAGRPKSRFSDQERLRILGATEEDLDAFIALFCPGRPLYAITRADSNDPRNWITPRGRLSKWDVMNHLLGNRLPIKNPRWVAPRCWEVTRWVGIDVDYRNGQKSDFIRRCRILRKVLRMLGVSSEHLRIDRTPCRGQALSILSHAPYSSTGNREPLSSGGHRGMSGQIRVVPSANQRNTIALWIPARPGVPRQGLA